MVGSVSLYLRPWWCPRPLTLMPLFLGPPVMWRQISLPSAPSPNNVSPPPLNLKSSNVFTFRSPPPTHTHARTHTHTHARTHAHTHTHTHTHTHIACVCVYIYIYIYYIYIRTNTWWSSTDLVLILTKFRIPVLVASRRISILNLKHDLTISNK